MHLHAGGVDDAMRNFGELLAQAELVEQARVLACTVSPRKSRRKSACFSITVTSTPARPSSKPSIIPAGPPPAMQHRVLRRQRLGHLRRGNRVGDGQVDNDLDMLASLAARNRVSPVNGILSWWDGVELWLSGLGFVLQTIVVMPLVLALAYGIAVALDALLGRGIQLVRRVRHSHEEPG